MARLWCDTWCLVPSRLLKKPGNGPKHHTGRDEVEIRYPVNYCFFWIPDIRLDGFRNDESRLPARHHARHASKARRAGKAAPTEATVGGHNVWPAPPEEQSLG